MDQIFKKASEEITYNSDFSIFIRTAGFEERKRVFLDAARKATEQQRKIIEKASAK